MKRALEAFEAVLTATSMTPPKKETCNQWCRGQHPQGCDSTKFWLVEEEKQNDRRDWSSMSVPGYGRPGTGGKHQRTTTPAQRSGTQDKLPSKKGDQKREPQAERGQQECPHQGFTNQCEPPFAVRHESLSYVKSTRLPAEGGRPADGCELRDEPLRMRGHAQEHVFQIGAGCAKNSLGSPSGRQ